MAKLGFKYRGGDRDVSGAARRSKQSSGSYDNWLVEGIPLFKPREGENTVRILPPTWVDDKEQAEKWGDYWDITIARHRNVGPDEATYLCLNKMQGKPCAVCDARKESRDDEERDALRIQSGPLCWMIDRNNEKAGPQVWAVPIKLFRELNLRSVDKKTEQLVLIDDPEDGYDVFFTREGNDKRTQYLSVEIDRDPTPLHEDEKKQQQWLDYIVDNPLPDVLNFYEYDYVKDVLYGAAPARKDADEDGGRRGRRGRDEESEERGGRPARRGREEEPEGRAARRGREAEAEDDGEKEDPPSRRRGREAEAEAEDPPPRRGRAGGRSGGEEEDPPSSRRRLSRSDDEGETEGEEEDTTKQARGKLSRLKERASR